MPPSPVKAWKGVRSAKAYANIAPQNPMAGAPVLKEPEPQSEDCLYLNVCTPAPDGRKRPVMLWIHGGAFSIGAVHPPTTAAYPWPKTGMWCW